METIAAHGGRLINRIADEKSRAEWLAKSESLPTIQLNAREISDINMIAVGAFSPLEGFMGADDYESVVERMRLANGLPWSLPVTLAVTGSEAATLSPGDSVLLVACEGTPAAILHLKEKFHFDREREADRVYRTTDLSHPGVKYLFEGGDILLGGKITLLNRLQSDEFLERRLDPADSRKMFHELGWKRVVGFQTRNPVHRAHEYIQKCALEVVDGLFLHPLVGETKSDDIPADVRMRCYEVLLDNYYPKDRVVLAILPAAMRYAGPREAIFHALVRKNYGCTHFIVGRDHAGVGNFYGSFDAHYIFDEFDVGELGIIPMFFDYTFYCRLCGGMASYKTCPHDSENHISLSGTKVREMLSAGEAPPREFSRPEVARILIDAMTDTGVSV